MRYDQKFKNYTQARLILENYLRPVPIRMKDLTAYCGHDYQGLRTAKNGLVRAGRLTKDDVTVLDHPDNIAMNLQPLGDLRLLPKPYTKVNEKKAAEARALAAEVLEGTSKRTGRLTEGEVKDILSQYIANGAGGKDFIAAVNAYLAFTATKEPLGLPAPLSPVELEIRLVRCLESCPPESADRAIATYLEARNAPAPDAAPQPATAPPAPPPDSTPESASDPAITEI